MKGIHWCLPLLLVCSLLMAGCSNNDEEEALPQTQQIDEMYPGDITKVDRIEIRSGSTGQLKKVEDRQQISAWIETIRDIEFVPDPNQEGRVGFSYGVSMFENDVNRFSFTPTSSLGHYYIYNEKLSAAVESLFESLE